MQIIVIIYINVDILPQRIMQIFLENIGGKRIYTCKLNYTFLGDVQSHPSVQSHPGLWYTFKARDLQMYISWQTDSTENITSAEKNCQPTQPCIFITNLFTSQKDICTSMHYQLKGFNL